MIKIKIPKKDRQNLFFHRGQMAVLYSLLTPIFLLFIGVALDLGWYYLNVSRLQNAADSAAVAGAQTLIKNDTNYKSVVLVQDYASVVKYIAQILMNKYIAESNDEAVKYASKNLSSNSDYREQDDGGYFITDAWNKDSSLGVSMKSSVYEYNDDLYYVIRLKEEIQHFFLAGWFDKMNAPVTAVAMISKIQSRNGRALNGTFEDEYRDQSNGKPRPVNVKPIPIIAQSDTVDPIFQKAMETLKNSNVIVGNWEIQKYYKDNNKATKTDSQGSVIETLFSERYGYDLYRKAA